MSGYSPYSQSAYPGQYTPSYGSNYSTYNSGYGSGYNRYNSGYNNNSYSNQYSNPYSKPMPQNPENIPAQPPPPNFKQDVWGLLNGFHALLQVLYAGTGIVHFGKSFLKMSLKILKAICGKSASAVFKMTGLNFLKKMIVKGFSSNDWSKDFNSSETLLEGAWKARGLKAGANKGIFEKILLVIRVFSMLGTMLALIMRSRERRQQPAVQVEAVGPECVPVSVEQKPVEFEGVRNFYEDIRLIEEESKKVNKIHCEEIIEVDEESSVLNSEEVVVLIEEASLDKEEVRVVSEEPENNGLRLLESQLVNSMNSIEKEEAKKKDDTDNKESPITLTNEVLDTMLMNSASNESNSFVNHQQTEVTRPVIEKIMLPEPQLTEKIVSEDFWKNKETSKHIESLQKEEGQVEVVKKEYELPSMLQSLREKSASSTKPWLMKKKKVVE